MDARLILAGQTVNPVNALAMGNQVGQQQNDMRYQQDYRSAVQQHGAGALGGNQASMNALAAFDPQVAQNLASNQLGMDQTRQQMRYLDDNQRMAVEQHAAGLSQAQRAEQAAAVRSGVAAGMQAQTPQQWDAYMSQDPSTQQYVGQFGNREMIAGSFLEMADAIEMSQGSDGSPTGAAATLAYRAREAGLQPGTEEYRNFMISNGGGVSVNVGGSSPAPPSGYRNVFDDNGNLVSQEVIPGGPASQDAAAAGRAAEVAGGNAATATRVIQNAAQRARTAAQDRMVGGLAGQLAAQNPGSQNAEVYRQVATLQSNAKIENLQAMRAASPTGGALGAVSDSENAMLGAKSGAIDPASPNFLRDLADYELTLMQVIHGNDAGMQIFQQAYPGGVPGVEDISQIGAPTAGVTVAPPAAATGPNTVVTADAIRQMSQSQLAEYIANTGDLSAVPDDVLEAIIERGQ